MKKIHVAIGPITPRASWKWLGRHLAESLVDSCTVHFFRRDELPLSDVVIFIKERPELPLQRALDIARHTSIRGMAMTLALARRLGISPV